MFALTESTPVYMCRQAVDMRKGIDGLYRLVRSELLQHPLSGAAFVFFSKNRQSVKVLRWDGINLFDYIVDILDKTGTWQPNTPLAKYRDLLPDRWVRR